MQTTAVTPFTSTAATQTDRGVTSMKSEDFFKLLVTELQQQDPLEPSKTSDMIGQVSQIRSIELSKQLTDALSQLTHQQHTAGASELIGKSITATMTADDGTEQETTGIVTGVRFDTDGSAVLELDTGQAVPAANVTHIAATGSATTSASAATTAANKNTQTAKTSTAPSGGLLPWLNLEGAFKL
jgi:flagellar basal-body rod modification protein FlgD